MDKIEISFSQTSEKFLAEATEVALPFITLFQDYMKEISPVLEEYHALLEKNTKGAYREEIGAVLSKSLYIKNSYFAKSVTDNIYITPQDTSPSRFAHFMTGCKIEVIMKTKKRITLVASFLDNAGGESYHQFILKPVEDTWLLDFIGIGYEDATGPFRKWNSI